MYVALGAVEKPFDLMFLSKTNFDRFRDACARFGCRVEAGVEMAGVESPSVDVVYSSPAGVTAPELSCVGMREASLRTASPRMVLMFLLRRWLGFQWWFRKGFGIWWMSICSMRAWWASASGVEGAILDSDHGMIERRGSESLS